MSKKLNWDKKNMDVICERTANKRETAYIWAIAVAIGHILEWIKRQEDGQERYRNSEAQADEILR